VSALRASAPILKKSAKWTANKMNDAAAASALYFGDQMKAYAGDWWNQSYARGLHAQYDPKYAKILGVKKTIKKKKPVAVNIVSEPDNAVRRRLQVPAEIEIRNGHNNVKDIYKSIRVLFSQFLYIINKCDDYIFTYKPRAIQILAEKVIFHIDQSSMPFSKTLKIKVALDTSIKKIGTIAHPSFKTIEEKSDPIIRLLLEKSITVAKGLIEEAGIISWLASIPN